MKKIKYIVLSLMFFTTISCESLVDGINNNPNEISSDSFEAGVLLLKGIELADISVQAGHQTRIGGMWSGQTKGLILLYKSIYEYNLSAEETNGIWENAYQGVVKQARVLREQTKSSPKAKQYSGITKVLEANALGTVASLFGDVPFSEISNDEISDPKFDSQKSVFAGLQTLLDEAIADLGASTSSAIPEDLMLAGNVTKWSKVAHTLKARFYIYTKEYDKANQQALLGISSTSEALAFTPPNIGNGSLNLNYKMINERGGYWGFNGSHLDNLLSGSRNNAKTAEGARLAYYKFDGNSASNNKGIAAASTPITLVGYEENLLILAETAVRTGKTADGLVQLNKLRAHLASGKAFTKLNATNELKYDAYELSDFDKGGIENVDNLDPVRALLREIIEERYVSGFTGLLAFDDLRRLGAKEKDIAVLPPYNSPTIAQYPQRFVVAQSELSANTNAPQDAGIFAITEVNK
ncbi:SusD/RagB family nutrient-binding outer membrane lipoprotein [Lacihabitans sp. LS3-19]|uniref:SusD/RagB family nutrient-binding outer membrane lipoprotein n=1 Tax=Lacihabitans sp. LS3-19 TaxID=2487335 RepID=UPI0020CD7B41|nr:SusD/RagB family nutrient-binding outer membrane lipoprotein [Lacihabitans sp. LS3-19]MCP9766274.1 SusD/RagB family nutrient-binding outer membrane lipoprotein [Lacihabitans sp. LS3-19]